MNVFIKNCLKIAGVSILLGLLLGIIGFGMDNTIFNNWENFNITIGDNNIRSGFRSDWNDSRTGNDDAGNFAGNSGNTNGADGKDKDDLVSGNLVSGNFNDVKSLSMDISYGTVNIMEGESFNIEVENGQSEEFESTINEGVWEIKDNSDYFNNSDNYSDITVFGIRISTNSHPFKPAALIVTVPEGFVFEDLVIELGAGAIRADRLTSQNAEIEVGAGSLRIKELVAEKESSYSIDTGELIIDDLTARNVQMDCGVGNLTASGSITGDSYVNCGIGNVDLDIAGKEEDYNYSVDCEIGTVIINNNSYSGINSKTEKNNNAENSFTLNCGIGKIGLKIR